MHACIMYNICCFSCGKWEFEKYVKSKATIYPAFFLSYHTICDTQLLHVACDWTALFNIIPFFGILHY